MAWGPKRGVEDLAAMVAQNKEGLVALHILPVRTFGASSCRPNTRVAATHRRAAPSPTPFRGR